MKTVLAGRPATFHYDFIVDGELVAPDDAVVTVYNTAQEAIPEWSEVSIDLAGSPANTATGFNLTITGEFNQIDSTNTMRYVSIRFSVSGDNYGFYQIDDFYAVRDSFFIPVTPDDVRSVTGVSSSELPDEVIDIYGAFALVEDDAGIDLNTILTSGSSLLPYLIEAVKLRAAMDTYNSVQSSMMQSEQADNSVYKRFAKVDFAAILRDLMGRYSKAIRHLTGDDTGGAAPILTTLAVGTDAVTGA